VIDTSASGAGNRHIHDSLILALETHPRLDPARTLAVVMWSEWDRDDFIADTAAVTPGRTDTYYYSDHSALVGTMGMVGESNCVVQIDAVKKIKNEASRALENYLQTVSLRSYLQHRGIASVFTRYRSAQCFDLGSWLPQDLQQSWNQQFDIGLCLGDMAHDTIDGFHPTPQWHRVWTQAVLLPFLVTQGLA
jgi:hypothetical protein